MPARNNRRQTERCGQLRAATQTKVEPGQMGLSVPLLEHRSQYPLHM